MRTEAFSKEDIFFHKMGVGPYVRPLFWRGLSHISVITLSTVGRRSVTVSDTLWTIGLPRKSQLSGLWWSRHCRVSSSFFISSSSFLEASVVGGARFLVEERWRLIFFLLFLVFGQFWGMSLKWKFAVFENFFCELYNFDVQQFF